MMGNNIYNELLSVSKQINTIIESLSVSTTEICETPAKYSYLSSLTYESFTARLITERRQRAKSFGSELFADPAWDMLLDLFIAMVQKKRISISSACIASSVPSTTGLRWLAHMCANGVLVRGNDPTDRRVSYVRLSDETFQQMVTYLDTIAGGAGVSLVAL